MDYGKALRIARAVSGLQQKDIAARSELDASYVSLIEKGKRTPSREAVRVLSDAFGMPVELFDLLATESNDVAGNPGNLDKIGKSLVELLLSKAGTKLTS